MEPRELHVLALMCLLTLLLAGASVEADSGVPSLGNTQGLASLPLLRANATAGGGEACRQPKSGGPTLVAKSISESSVEAHRCYRAGEPQSLCFSVYDGSADGEKLDGVGLIFPNVFGLGPWNVSCKSEDSTDSSGHPASFTCSTPTANHVTYIGGEIVAGASWGFCVDLGVPAGYGGPRVINWNLSGDEQGSPPHLLTGQVVLEQCLPLMVFPTQLDLEGCAGLPQVLPFEVWNNTSATRTVALSFDISTGNGTFAGSPSVVVAAGATEVVLTELEADACLAPGAQVMATFGAQAGADSDSSQVTQTASDFGGWSSLSPSPQSTMDNVVVGAVLDGGLWSIGGYEAKGATQRYDPLTDSWSTHAVEPEPLIQYPMDGCYGVGASGDEVVVLFPDTLTSATALHRYNITDDAWETPPIPVGFPSSRWAQDIVSLFGITGQNVCYISGGATSDGGGNVNNLWEYRPDTNVTVYLGNFTHHPAGFDFHASWFVPWVGEDGSICVGGGIDGSAGIVADTQCYDLRSGTFNSPNADLGQLPTPWWGMADGFKIHDGRYQIWVALGLDGSAKFLPLSAYADETTGGFVVGPDVPTSLYRLEGGTLGGHFYTFGGSRGGFVHTDNALTLQQCLACEIPLFADGFESGGTGAWSHAVP